MKTTIFFLSSCSMSLLFDLATSQSWYLDDYALQARSLNHLLPRAGGIMPGGRRMGIPSQQAPAARPQALGRPYTRIQASSGAGPKGKSGNKTPEPDASASMYAKGSASMHAITPADYREAYNGHGGEGKVQVEHPKRVLAVGTALGTPGGITPDGAQLPIDQHPLRGKASGRAVRGQVEAPAGGKGHIQIDSTSGTQKYEVPGGTTLEKSAKGTKSNHVKVTASVTDGGHVRVAGGPSKKSLNEEFPLPPPNKRLSPPRTLDGDDIMLGDLAP